jgi:hypothetical protein
LALTCKVNKHSYIRVRHRNTTLQLLTNLPGTYTSHSSTCCSICLPVQLSSHFHQATNVSESKLPFPGQRIALVVLKGRVFSNIPSFQTHPYVIRLHVMGTNYQPSFVSTVQCKLLLHPKFWDKRFWPSLILNRLNLER